MVLYKPHNFVLKVFFLINAVSLNFLQRKKHAFVVKIQKLAEEYMMSIMPFIQHWEQRP